MKGMSGMNVGMEMGAGGMGMGAGGMGGAMETGMGRSSQSTIVSLDGGEVPSEENPTMLATAKSDLKVNLAVDTAINELNRRIKIHRYMLGQKSIKLRPNDMTKWLYREVLHADLDDPYMGLGGLLFETYPFADEDSGVASTTRTELPAESKR